MSEFGGARATPGSQSFGDELYRTVQFFVFNLQSVARLAAIAGGPTQTRLPQTGSPFIDAISTVSYQADGANGIATDQRGVTPPPGRHTTLHRLNPERSGRERGRCPVPVTVYRVR